MLHRSLCLEGEVLKLTLKYSYISVLNVHIKDNSLGKRKHKMKTVMGDALVEGFSDRGSIPLSSISRCGSVW